MALLVPLRKKKANPVPSFHSTLSIELLPGEITVAQATKVQQVLFFNEKLSRSSFSVAGTLICTNRRISFIPDKSSPEESERCLLEASKSIPLSCVDRVHVAGNKTRKVLDGVSTLPKHVFHLHILCKDVKKLQFNLKSCPKSEASSLVNAIGRHTHPNSVHLLFAYDYTRALKDLWRHDHFSSETPPVVSFLNARDWQRELLRLGVTNDQWRVSEANKHFLVCDSLCPYFPCPTIFSDVSLESAASLHSNNRIPVWCWSHPRTGVSLTRGGVTMVEDELEAPDPSYRVSIAMARHTDSQVENKEIKRIEILHKCGSVKNLQSAFRKIRELCTPGNSSELASIDKHWFSGVESSGWMTLVRHCLISAKEVTHLLCIKRHSVMLLEESGCDFSCVVSSLVELMADPHYRSISGFENLVQKEWVAYGHPFTTRHGLVPLSIEEDYLVAPVFLIFLDCVWQLSKQFPSAFEFSEFFLLRFYDMVTDCLYSNFLYNSTKHRLQASLHSRRSCFFGMGDEPLEMMDDYEGPLFSAWGRWRESMTEEENEQCLNPLYYVFGNGDTECDSSGSAPLSSQFGSILMDSTNLSTDAGLYSDREATPVSIASQDVDYYRQGLLVPETSLCSLRIWDGFFFRYLPELGACHCRGQLEVQQLESRMVRDVQKLKEELNEVELSMGAFTTDLPSCIGEVVQEREREIMDERRGSVEVGMPLRPRLTASMYSYSGIGALEEVMMDEADRATEQAQEQVDSVQHGNLSDDATPVNSPHSTPTKLQQQKQPQQKQPPQNGSLQVGPGARESSKLVAKQTGRQTSLAQFTDALYSSELEDGGSLRPKALVEVSSPGPGITRSPVTKTRLRVVKSHTSDPVVAAWQQSSPRQILRHSIRDTTYTAKEGGETTLATNSQLIKL